MHQQLFSFNIIIVHLHAYITMTTVHVIYILLSNFMHLCANGVTHSYVGAVFNTLWPIDALKI